MWIKEKYKGEKMGFFDDFGKKVTDAGQKAMQKTQEMSEVARVNSLISQNENKINNVYYQIGKLFVSTYGDDCKPEFAGLVATVVELEQQNITYRKQIQDIKGIQHCEKCGAEVPKGVAFCSSCGAAMPKVDKQVVTDDCVKCSSCGAMVKKSMRFCTACGQAMTQPVVAPVDAGMETLSEPAQEALIKTLERVCTKCGARVPGDSVFCTECGAKL